MVLVLYRYPVLVQKVHYINSTDSIPHGRFVQVLVQIPMDDIIKIINSINDKVDAMVCFDGDDEKQFLDSEQSVLILVTLYYNWLIVPLAVSLCRKIIAKKSKLLKCQETIRKSRHPSMFDARLSWDTFCSRHCHRADFTRHIRMSFESFEKLLSFIRDDLEVDKDMAALRGGAILPEICLYVTLRFLAGGSYSDIRFFTGITVPSFYRIVWKTISAINNSNSSELQIKFPSTVDECKEAALGFKTISTQGCIWNCVAVLDGYHLQIQTPPKKYAKNVRSFFSGHYQTSGMNIQAACDHNCKFSFIGVAGPGVLGDREALNEVPLGKQVENLPGLYCAIGDCAYTPTEHLIPIFRGEHAVIPRYDNFNFFASQLRIRIEMAFGLMVKKWGILSRPLLIKPTKIWELIIAIAKLHNFCIDERLSASQKEGSNQSQPQVPVFTPTNVAFDRHDTMLRDEAAFQQFEELQQDYENTWSHNRDRMVREIESQHLTRPGRSRFGA